MLRKSFQQLSCNRSLLYRTNFTRSATSSLYTSYNNYSNNFIKSYSSNAKNQQQNKEKFQQVIPPEELLRQRQLEQQQEDEIDDPEALIPLDPVQFITESDLGVKFVIGVPKPLEQVSEKIQESLQNKDYRYLNPFNYLFPQRTFALDIAYMPLKVKSYFKSMVPFKRDKLEKRLLKNFHKLFSSIENNDIDELNAIKLDGTQMAIESFRDVFHTLRQEKIEYKFSFRDVRVIIDHVEPSLPFFQANALYFIDAEFRLPALHDKPIQVSYYTPIVWLCKFPEMTEEDQRELEDINFDTEVEWRPARIEMVGVVREIAEKRVEEIMQRLKDSYRRIVEEAEERQEQRLESEKKQKEEQEQLQQQQSDKNSKK